MPSAQAPAPAQTRHNIAPADDAGVEVINAFLEALRHPDADASAQVVLTLVHSSLTAQDGEALNPQAEADFRKARARARSYDWPVRVTRVQRLQTTAIGHLGEPGHERGYELIYYIAGQPGEDTPPAPITVFFPDSGEAPKISEMGNL